MINYRFQAYANVLVKFVESLVTFMPFHPSGLHRPFNFSFLEVEPHFSKTCSRNRCRLGEKWKKRKVSFKIPIMFLTEVNLHAAATLRFKTWLLQWVSSAIGAIFLFFLVHHMLLRTWHWHHHRPVLGSCKRQIDVVLGQTWQNSVCYALTSCIKQRSPFSNSMASASASTPLTVSFSISLDLTGWKNVVIGRAMNAGRRWRRKHCFTSRGEQIIRG